jgi:ATP-dependent RNA helicase RhlE
MLDMGFIPDIKRIMALLPKQRQNLLFSATFSQDIKRLADELLNAPQLIEVARRNTAAEAITQKAYRVPQEGKRALLEHIVRSRGLWQVLCFVRTKHGASRLARQLEKDGLATSAIHGDKTQQARLEALQAFKDGKLQVLVATDVAARGLDIDDLPLVVNYELPHTPEDYIHRIGRTGRAGAAGEAISLVAHEEEKYLVEIERLLKKKIDVEVAGDVPAAPRADHSERATAGRREHRAERTTGARSERTTGVRGERTTGVRGERRTEHPAPRSKAEDLPQAAVARPAQRVNGHDDARTPPVERSRREIEREEAYARNPDQPIVHHHARIHPVLGHKAHRPVPALLKKRPLPEPEKV